MIFLLLTFKMESPIIRLTIRESGIGMNQDRRGKWILSLKTQAALTMQI